MKRKVSNRIKPEDSKANNAERAQLVPRHRAEEGGDLLSAQAGGEGGVVAQLLDVCGSVGAVEDDSQLHGAAGRASEVVGASTRGVGVEGRLAALITGHQDLGDIELSASGGPARAAGLTVLEGTWDLGVQHPDGGHVGVEAGGGVLGHAELEEEDLVGAVEAVVGDGAGADVAAAVALDALVVGEDGELLVAADKGVGEDGGGGGATGALGVEVGEGVTEDVVEDAGSVSAVVAEEGQAVEGLGLGVVVTAAGVGGVGVSGLLLLLVGNWGGWLGSGSHGGGLGVLDLSSSWGGGVGGDSAAGAEVVVLPGLDDTVDGGGHDVGALLDGLLERARVEGLVAVAAVGVGVALGGAGGLGVGGDLLEGDGATEVEGDLLIERGERAGVGDGGAGARAVAAHRGHLVVGAGVADVGVLDGVDELAEVVAAIEGGAGGALVGNGGGGSKGQDEGGDAHGEMHFEVVRGCCCFRLFVF
ncbi:hypothetical protein V496_01129 [Pseudogymnoascus sp. VKM F-4515 (FW-2607)]|nr:hypothetical protein V496_01129 [Pseudogymnoascus sp. VKM F-4515 (FW-2607)]KFY93886.1 hypothetical protein V498_04193 [Pseudogymnoascus sp. VKM F-4517 (FW-2822)]